MRHFFRGRMGSCAVFLLVAVLVVGGLGWVTYAALEVEREQFRARADADLTQKLHVALWRLDGRVAPALAVDSCWPVTIWASPVKPGSRRRKAGMPVTSRIGFSRGSCFTNAMTPSSRSAWVLRWMSIHNSRHGMA